MKKIAIFGATGMTGLCTVEAALKQGEKIPAPVVLAVRSISVSRDEKSVFKTTLFPQVSKFGQW